MKIGKWISFCALLLLAACTKKDENRETGMPQQVYLDQAYGSDARQQLDVYLPEGRKHNTPLLIFLHGGGFVAGDKKEVSHVAQLFLEQGYAVVNMNYRLVDSVGLRQKPILHRASTIRIAEQLADIRLALDYIAAHSGEWQLSSSHWILAGHSAGATLALLYAHGDQNSSRQIRAAANFAGATTFAFSDESELALLDPVLVEVLYRATGKEAINANKLAYMAISPYWVSNNSSNLVPVVNIRPSKDSGHDLYQAYTSLLSSKATANQYMVIEGAGHGFDPEGKWAEAISKASVFLKAELK